jgi:hypothetical protein
MFEYSKVRIIRADEGLKKVMVALWISFSWHPNYEFRHNLIMGCTAPGSLTPWSAESFTTSSS